MDQAMDSHCPNYYGTAVSKSNTFCNLSTTRNEEDKMHERGKRGRVHHPYHEIDGMANGRAWQLEVEKEVRPLR